MGIHPLYLWAIVPTLVVLGLVGGILLRRSPRSEWGLLGGIFALELPMFFVSTYVIREPLNLFINARIDPATPLGLFLRSFQAPFIEEACKLWLVLLLFRMGRLNRENALRLAMAVGATFGISEIWGLAHRFAQIPVPAGQPWYYFLGFVQERILVAPLHGVFVIAAARKLGLGGKALAIGLLSEFLLHYFANFPIFLAKLNVGNLGPAVWAVILSIYIGVYCILLLALLAYFVYGETGMPLTKQKARCPGCKEVYARPLFRLNMGPLTSYERCSRCLKYHWIYKDNWVKDDAKNDATAPTA